MKSQAIPRRCSLCDSQAVGTAARYAFVVVLALPCFSAQPRYTVIEFPTSNTWAYDVNDAGHVAALGDGRSYLYKDGTLIPLGNLGGNFSHPTSLNNHDEVVGLSTRPSGTFSPLPFLYTGGRMVDIIPTATTGVARAINDSGVVVGTSNLGPFIYDHGALSFLPDSSALPTGINNRGEITGSFGKSRGFLYSGGVMTDIGTLGGSGTWPHGINDRGEIVGRSRVNDTDDHIFLFSGGVMRDLGACTGFTTTAINNLGQIVADVGGGDAYIYENGQWVDLNTLINFTGTRLEVFYLPQSISNTGYIVGFGRFGVGGVDGFLLKPNLVAAPTPGWWAQRGVLDINKLAADFAAANHGQAKHLARKAYDELQLRLSGGAGPELAQLIASWSKPANATDYATLNLGQLKNLVKPFYDRLAEAGYHGPPLTAGQVYPWSTLKEDDYDYAAANIGQIKHLFSFDLGGSNTDTDNDSLPDWWENWHFGNLTAQTASGDPDGDGLTNLQEYNAQTNPAVPNT